MRNSETWIKLEGKKTVDGAVRGGQNRPRVRGGSRVSYWSGGARSVAGRREEKAALFVAGGGGVWETISPTAGGAERETERGGKD